jgi:heme-degrading monooxygenase HmoA
MVITVFRARVRPEMQQEYVAWVERVRLLASSMPGFISHKGFAAEDGERVSIVEFESEEAQHAWRIHPEHLVAQRRGRKDFYRDYHIQVCSVLHESVYPAP